MMDYDIHTLLAKLGLNELIDKKELRWSYIDTAAPEISGCAHARFTDDGHKLIVDLHHHLRNTDEEEGETGNTRVERVQLKARRIGESNLFRISTLSFDDQTFDGDNGGMVNLCCGLFYARALKINELMIAQRFDAHHQAQNSAEDQLKEKQDIRRKKIQKALDVADNMMGVIVPLKPRKDAPFQRI